ncbi:MAG: hypothetical protein ABSE06_17655 [Anaerolineaceae bacterium]
MAPEGQLGFCSRRRLGGGCRGIGSLRRLGGGLGSGLNVFGSLGWAGGGRLDSRCTTGDYYPGSRYTCHSYQFAAT